MNKFTDKGRGAYLFIDSADEINRMLKDKNFIANFDLAVKDIRLKMDMPPGWKMVKFHGEQVSTKASEVIPQYLSPNDQMIYHLIVAADVQAQNPHAKEFQFEAEYTPIGGTPQKLAVKRKVSQMLSQNKQILKGDAIVEYAEMLKKIKYPLDKNKKKNLEVFQKAHTFIALQNKTRKDQELTDILALMKKYENTIKNGESFPSSIDQDTEEIGPALGLGANELLNTSIIGKNPKKAIKALSRLNQSIRLVPLEGYKFLALSSGPVGNPRPAGGGGLGSKRVKEPVIHFMGKKKIEPGKKSVLDLHQIKLKLRAPNYAKSFSFDFNFFSAEYPNFIKKNFNDTFYAIIEAGSTNDGKQTNISFDSNNNSIEVDNNYFQNEFHPIPNTGTGFDYHGSTGWLRTSWPIKGGEVFTLTFSIHDEGDAIYDSLVILDNFKWHDYEAVGTTDPLN
jgi:hypothetical protein